MDPYLWTPLIVNKCKNIKLSWEPPDSADPYVPSSRYERNPRGPISNVSWVQFFNLCLKNFDVQIYPYFEGVCLTTVILAPGASEGGLRATVQVPLWRDSRDPRDPGMSSARPDLVRRLRTPEPNARNWVAKSDKYTQICQNITYMS